MIKVRIIGTEKAVESLARKQQAIFSDIRDAVTKGANMVRSTAMSDYLRGPRPQKLGVVSGDLYRSIHPWVDFEKDSIIGKVGTNVWYGVQWETGKIPPGPKHKPVRGAQRTPKGAPKGPPASQKTRPFLKPALKDRQKDIFDLIRKAVNTGVK